MHPTGHAASRRSHDSHDPDRDQHAPAPEPRQPEPRPDHRRPEPEPERDQPELTRGADSLEPDCDRDQREIDRREGQPEPAHRSPEPDHDSREPNSEPDRDPDRHQPVRDHYAPEGSSSPVLRMHKPSPSPTSKSSSDSYYSSDSTADPSSGLNPSRAPNPNTSLSTTPDPTLIPRLVAVFRAHRPTRLEPYPGVREALTRLRMAGVRLAVITDGDVDMQAWKVRALGLSAFFECVVVSDALGGRAARKPHSAPFLAALEGLGVAADRCVVVGDRPEKDVTGAAGVDIRAIRVKTGEYHQVPDAAGTWHTATDFPAAVDWLLNG